MKWITVLLAAVVAGLMMSVSGAAHQGLPHHKGYHAPDDFCAVYADVFHRLNCVKAQRVVYTIFPRGTRRSAMLVVKCETGHTFDRWATNRSSRTASLFQVHPGNHGTRWTWKGHGTFTIDSNRLYNAWYNAQAALYMSEGGENWGQWDPVCHPF